MACQRISGSERKQWESSVWFMGESSTRFRSGGRGQGVRDQLV
jgi:hypothetical protein